MRYAKYLYVQLKRTLKLAVGVFPTAMLLCACLGIAAYFLLTQGPLTTRQEKYKIGIVGSIDDTYLGFGVAAIQTLDSSRFMVEFLTMEEEEAKKAFREGELVAYVNVPEEFLDSIIYGRNDVPITYVASEGGQGLQAYLMEELAALVSRLVTSSQGSIYAMQEVVYEYGDSDKIWDWTNELNLQLIDHVLGRTKLAELEVLGLSKGLLIRQYYFCTVLLLFCFLFGITSASFFLKRNASLGKWMKLRGIGATGQVLCEYVVYFALMLLCVLVPFGALSVATHGFSFLKMRIYPSDLVLCLIPIVLMASAFHFVIYELVRNPVANLLLQFLGVIGMGYVSGYIYPASFFPDGIARIGRILPTGAALEAFSGAMLLERRRAALWTELLYFACFLGIAILARKRLIEREG
ncbi:MAG: ABC transporter permease [Lachnospiraceae bacterium]|nr:ABC transporter permease [Lachnospiraceae bacterium]